MGPTVGDFLELSVSPISEGQKSRSEIPSPPPTPWLDCKVAIPTPPPPPWELEFPPPHFFRVQRRSSFEEPGFFVGSWNKALVKTLLGLAATLSHFRTLAKKRRLNGLTFSLLSICNPQKFKPFSLLGQVSCYWPSKLLVFLDSFDWSTLNSHLKMSKKTGRFNTWMSQEVSKRLLSGL